MENLFKNIPADLPAEIVETIAGNKNCRIERIVSRGHSSPEKGGWYDQEQDEWVLLLSGAATIEFEDGEDLHLKPGDSLTIKAHHKHRVKWTDPEENSVWVAVFF
ncbi:MAG: cupin domain-containing protein [Planctomycetes bacterium]|nr:cupin domain-containing protein [Planctomycetota bacterium]